MNPMHLGGGSGKVSDGSVGKAAVSHPGIPRGQRTDPFRGSWKLPAVRTRLDLAFKGSQVYFTFRTKTR
jgi:hypothetical protein